MTLRAVSIALKIPDNEAYTALVALRRLGVDVRRVERSAIYVFDDGDVEALKRRVMSDATIFNPSKHRLTVLDEAVPRAGEIWIEPLSHPSTPLRMTQKAATAWRLFDAHDNPAGRETLTAAADRLLRNPAIQKATF
jgi:phosphoribosylformylglycinamidine (FGAM) synthase PurS component